MFQQISQEIQQLINHFPEQDSILFNNQPLPINQTNFQAITPASETKSTKSLTFIDGGQAEILSAANFCLSFIRIFAITFNNNKKTSFTKKEFYLFTKAVYQTNELYYQSKIFGDQILDKQDLFIYSHDQTIRTGTERAPISKIANLARRFAELSLAKTLTSDFIILDGTLTPTFPNEEKYLRQQNNISALAKSSQLFTTSGNNPHILLNKIAPHPLWHYKLTPHTSFVKLHERAQHIFRFEGNPEVLPYLIPNSQDPLFLGYPYGLILADKFARISNEEKNSLKIKFLIKNPEIANYLNTTNAHDILDSLG